jgi:hypothetical protein
MVWHRPAPTTSRMLRHQRLPRQGCAVVPQISIDSGIGGGSDDAEAINIHWRCPTDYAWGDVSMLRNENLSHYKACCERHIFARKIMSATGRFRSGLKRRSFDLTAAGRSCRDLCCLEPPRSVQGLASGQHAAGEINASPSAMSWLHPLNVPMQDDAAQ